ncbi:MAG: DUF3365 domain-containing protein [Gemmatimonadota bacterium]|nr:MAG: DUF3365 domain-containing protein [Gemmatimonadota bacterium]
MHRQSLLAVVSILACSTTLSCVNDAQEVTPEDERWVSAVGRESASTLAGGLIQRLTAALQEGGPEHAVNFCSREALELTATIEHSLTDGIELKRTSMKYRNPANAPDELEVAAIAYFQDVLATKHELPPYLVQRTSQNEFRYYQPLMVNEMCLQCHGTTELIAPEVQQAIETSYPNDLATGYAVGELRGLIRVTVPSRVLEDT